MLSPVYTPAATSVVDPVIVTSMRLDHIPGVTPMSAPTGHPQEFSSATLPLVLKRFAEGQFVALVGGKVVSYAITMRTNRNPGEAPLAWQTMIGDMSLQNHDPQGEWLYGVDFYVNEHYRRLGIGSKMYQARFNLVKKLNLRGMYAGGMLAGYYRYQQQMSPREYGERIISGELEDPTVTMQIRRGFKPRAVIEQYAENSFAGNAAILIEWRNPDYRPAANAFSNQPAA